MKANKLDTNIKDKLQNRTFTPSASAWERLSAQLDEQPKQKKKGWFFYVGAAASILLLVAIGIQFISSEKDEIHPKEIIVNNAMDTIIIDKKIDKLINEIPIEKAIVKNEVEKKLEVKKTVIANKVKQSVISKNKISKKKRIIIAKVDNIIEEIPAYAGMTTRNITENSPKTEKQPKTIIKQDPNSRIKINSEDLLFAVTHSPKEVKEYYAKYNVSREDVLKTIKSELKKSNIKINPNTILAEVERTIGEEDFQNKFMKSLKRRVSDIATAIASRND